MDGRLLIDHVVGTLQQLRQDDKGTLSPLELLCHAEQQLVSDRGEAAFNAFGLGPSFLQFCVDHQDALLPHLSWGTHLDWLAGGMLNGVSASEVVHFIAQAAPGMADAPDTTADHIRAALLLHFDAPPLVTDPGSWAPLLRRARAVPNRQCCVAAAFSASCQGLISAPRAPSVDTAAQAVKALLSVRTLCDLDERSKWSVTFLSAFGPLGEFLRGLQAKSGVLASVDASELEIMEVKRGRFMRVPPGATVEGFASALQWLDGLLAAALALALCLSAGSIITAPLHLLAQMVRAVKQAPTYASGRQGRRNKCITRWAVY